jgi:hypothetical protein
MSDAGDADLLDEFLDAAGLGGIASRDTSPQPHAGTAPKQPPKKRKTAPKSTSTKPKRRKRTYLPSNPPPPALVLTVLLVAPTQTRNQTPPTSRTMNSVTLQ